MDEIIKILKQFTKDRDWEQFHTPKNLAVSISLEASELLDHFQWVDDEVFGVVGKQAIKYELADIFIYCLLFADKIGLNYQEIVGIIINKIELNNKKYPINKSKGNSKKYSEFK